MTSSRDTDAEAAVRQAAEKLPAPDDPAFAGTMTMTWEVTAVDVGTRVDIRADDVPAGVSAEDHAAGLASSLANLAEHLGS